MREIDSTEAAVIVVVAGLLVIGGLAAYAMTKSDDMAPLASAAFGVIGSVVGAFFGVHAGAGMASRASDHAREATENARREAAKTQRMLVLMLPEGQQKQAMNDIISRSDPEPPGG